MENPPISRPRMPKLAWTKPTLQSVNVKTETQAVQKDMNAKVTFGHDVLLFGAS